MRQAGIWLGASGLKPDAATTVRAPQGDVVVTDGPYAETKEVVFSFIDAEDVVQDAFVAAAVEWDRRGVPDRPGAWLTTTAWRKALDRLRHDRVWPPPVLPISRMSP